MIQQQPTKRQLQLRALVAAAVEAEKAAGCPWCVAATTIPKPSLNHLLCVEHLALSVEWSRWFATAADFAPSIRLSIAERGLAIARAKMGAAA